MRTGRIKLKTAAYKATISKLGDAFALRHTMGVLSAGTLGIVRTDVRSQGGSFLSQRVETTDNFTNYEF